MRFLNFPSNMKVLALLLGFLGFLDFAYLTFKHYSGILVPCGVAECETVLTSSYSTFFGIPVALFGAAYFLLFLVFLVAFIDTGKPLFFRMAFSLPVLALPISLWFLYVQAALLHAYCLYCLASDVFTGALVILLLLSFRRGAVEK